MVSKVNTIKVNGEEFDWSISTSSRYTGLHWFEDQIEVLKIESPNNKFGLLLKIVRGSYTNGLESCPYIFLSPALVIGESFPSNEKAVDVGTRFAIRPKISLVRGEMVLGKHVERVVQWCLSENFKVRKCGLSGCW